MVVTIYHMLAKVTKSYHLLPKVAICCQKLPFVAKSYQTLPFVAKSYHLLAKVTKSYHLLPTGTIRLPGQNVALPNRDNMSPGTKCRPFEQQNNGDIGRHIVPATYCPGTIYVLGQNVAGQNVSWPIFRSHCFKNRGSRTEQKHLFAFNCGFLRTQVRCNVLYTTKSFEKQTSNATLIIFCSQLRFHIEECFVW